MTSPLAFSLPLTSFDAVVGFGAREPGFETAAMVDDDEERECEESDVAAAA